jgi:hypothetical protein
LLKPNRDYTRDNHQHVLYLAIAFIIATGLFAIMRITLRHKKLSLQQFFTLYLLAVIGLVLIFLGVTGRLHWLFALIGSLLPFLAGFARWGLRLWRAAGVFATLRQIMAQLTGLNAERQSQPRRNTSQMTVSEALDILGLDESPTADEIKAAHRQLIQKLHPDRGGSTLLAKQVNEAKQVMLDHVG